MKDHPETRIWGPLTRTDFVRYAGASGDFNPLHHDLQNAQAAGLPDVMAQGMYLAGILATTVQDWFGKDSMHQFSVRFRAAVWPGDILEARCVSVVRQLDEVVLELSLCRGQEEVLSGSARVKFKQKADIHD